MRQPSSWAARARLHLRFCTVWLALLGACAAPSEGRLALADRPTESDRSPERRRAELRLELARAYLEQGQAWVALDEVKQALALSPELAFGWNLRGVVYAQLGDIPRAQASFERALALAPGDPEAAYNQAWLTCQQRDSVHERNAQAQTELRRLLAQSGPALPSARIWLALANCQAGAGQTDRALDSLAQPALQQADAAQTLWLAVKLARRLDNDRMVQQLGGHLRQRFGRSPQAAAYDRGAWDE